MQPDKFLELQYQSLREEIRETKARIARILVFGVTVVPAAQFLADAYKIDVVIVSMPLLVVVISFLYLSENHALMRCGRFIRLEIENRIDGVVGWENWLTTPAEYEKRSVDRFVTYSFYLLYFLYFAASVFLACRFTNENFGVLWTAVLLGCYSAIGLWFALYFFRNMQVSTTTRSESG